ncbi:integrin beta-2-like isoform X1 [Triplophysa dalaica]|uniref:integrin beta-2-like isoform X1 n=2 Tax=Triplophysa dalaica TaxID=1582913 RepID=UPI0024DF7DD0|nr:integrin beta-2-like isoform X1 [Triplophysa dalaica]XP_056611669.1 integrin beta-2-like isoform X1 [Triplophysa dalaica]XP_056611670.1 integrin beta-2-like isoform X1 [Triplophysa dalaica]
MTQEMLQSVCLRGLLLLLVGKHVCTQEQCLKASVKSCGDCIISGPGCAWCKDLNFNKPGEQEAVRCDTVAVLTDKGCSAIIDPQNKLNKISIKPLTNGSHPVQITPQEIELNLRPGKPHTFTVTFKRAEGYPVDLYYLMDLSYSMKDDLENVKKLGSDLLNELKRKTGNARIGFGAFVDKTLLPFTDTNEVKLQRPCPDKNEPCQPAFGFEHVLSLTADGKKFKKMVAKQHISGNLDAPEGSLDAIMQAAVCMKEIGWGNSTRLLVLATDDGFHMAGDGKLAAILEPNQGTCQLVNNKYSKSNFWDYPSVGQIARKLEEQNIQPIFAVTKKMESVYESLSQLIPKSAVGVLSDDSSNVVNLIVDAYNNLTSEVIMAHDFLPNHISIKYASDCKDGEMFSDRGRCANVAIGQTVAFDVTVTAEKCIKNQTFNIGPLGFGEKLKVTVSTRCECECDDTNKPHPHCGGSGVVVCGGCRCNQGFIGGHCECQIGQKDEASLRAQCKKDNGTECEGKGDCVCGRCQCHITEGNSQYYGEFCDCDDEHCENFNNTQCGGHGQCKCGKCKCHEGYEGTACHCAISDVACKTQGTVCHNRGTCVCNQCECLREYKRPYCKECPTCQAPCQQSASCVECLAFESGPFKKNCSEACNHLKLSISEKLAKSDCRVKDAEGCWMTFTMTEQDGFDKYLVNVLKSRDCPKGPNIAAIVGGSLAGGALIGLLILLIVKACLHARDLRDWRRFEEDRKLEKFSGINPIFQNATIIQNPTFSEDS